MVMINLENYKVDGQEIDVKAELVDMLRMAGVYANGDQLCAGIELSNRIGDHKSNEISLSVGDDEHNILKCVLNALMIKATPPFGGPRYNELIMRVFKARK